MKRILTFPHRGPVPPDQPGYERDRGDPYTFRLTWVPCELRVVVEPCKGCPGRSQMEFCNHFDKPADVLECMTCGGKTLPIEYGLKERAPMVIEESLDMGGTASAAGH